MSDPRRHPSEKELLLAADGELSGAETKRIEAHLKACWICRGLRHDMEAAIAMFVSVHGAVLDSRISPNGPSRALLAARLNAHQSIQDDSPQSWWSRLRLTLSRVAIPDATLLLPCAVALGLAAMMALLLSPWNRSKLSANALLARAASSETQALKSVESGVVYQKIRIRTSKRAFERSVYGDVKGRRRPRQQALAADDAQLEIKLALAGVSWEQPLSAAGYKQWHDRQQAPKDEVQQTSGRVTLTTTISGGTVAEESLTLRDTDFHPVRRTVEFRDAGNVEITEVNYHVLDWAAVGEGTFEPQPEMTPAAPLRPRLPLLTRSEIDEAELQARLVLNHLNADSGERIEIIRKANGIEVRGIVETDERKRELQGWLRPLPHVASSIFSFQDMRSRPGAASDITSVRAYSVVTQPSPLEKYLTEKGWERDQVSQLQQQLLNASITIHQESKAVAELLQRFETAEPATETAQTALNELVSDHKAKLMAKLEEEQRLIGRIEIPARTPNASLPISASADAVNLRSMAERNFTLCTQLTSGSDAAPPVQSLFSELAESIAQLHAIATTLHLRANHAGHQPLSEK